MYNILIAGAAGDGIETAAGVFEKILLRSGSYVFSMRDFMSRVRGGHNFALIRFGENPVYAHRDQLDGLIVLNKESYDLHKKELKKNCFVIADSSLEIDNKHLMKFDMSNMAKESGNKKTIGSICIGILLKLFGIPIDKAKDVFKEMMGSGILDANLKALKMGHDAAKCSIFYLPVKPPKNKILINGNDSMALGALAGGIRFYSAYPMSPSTGLLNFFTAQSESFRIGVEQAEDEIAAINMALGASYAGARAMTGTSGGGFSLMVEALGFSGIAEIPLVLADIQRPGPATGLPTRTEQSDLHFVISAAQGEFPRMVIAVRDHADAFYQTARAFYLAEKYQIPVILLSDQYLADSSVTMPELNHEKVMQYGHPLRGLEKGDDASYMRYKLTRGGISPFRIPGKTKSLVRIDSDEHDEQGVITESAAVRNTMQHKRMSKLLSLKKDLVEPEFYGDELFDILAVGFGSTSGAIKEAINIWNETSGEKAAALLFGDVYPLPTKKLLKYAKDAKCIVNIEQNYTGQLARLIRQETLISCGKSILKYDGRQLSVDDILRGFKKISPVLTEKSTTPPQAAGYAGSVR